MRTIILTVIVLFNTILSVAAPKIPDSELAWKNVEVDHMKTAVFTIFRDSRGLMWIGSNHGLSFYDGINTHPVGTDLLNGTHVHSIIENDNKLYLGTNNGLFILNLVTGEAAAEPTVTDREIRTLLLNDDDLWIGSLNGLTLFHIPTSTQEDMTEGLPHKSVYSLLRDSRGIIYAGTYGGPARWDNQARKFHPLTVKTAKMTLSPFLANCLLESADRESIYVGGEGVLLRYHISSDSWEHINGLEGLNIKSLEHGADNRLIIGSHEGVHVLYPDGKLRHYHHNSQQITSLADNEIWCLYCDSLQNIWAGHERGFSVASDSESIRSVRLDALTGIYDGNDIYAIHRDADGNLWLGGSNGIIRLDKNNEAHWYNHSDSPGALSHKRIRGIHEGPGSDMWFATDGGIDRYDPSANLFNVYHLTDSDGNYNSNWVYAVGETGSSFWSGGFLSGIHLIDKDKLGTRGGIFKADRSLNNANKRFGDISLGNDMVSNVVTDGDGRLWIILFRDSRVFVYNPETDTLIATDIHELTGSYPSLIAADKVGNVWVAFNGGVVAFGKKSRPDVIRFPHTEGDNSPMAIGAVDDGIWVSTLTSVWSVDGKTLQPHMRALPQKIYTAIYDDYRSGNVILGGSDEIIVINKRDPGVETDFRRIRMAMTLSPGTPLQLSDIAKDGEGMTIPYGGGLSLMVSTLDYSPDAVQRFMYKLTDNGKESDSDWIILPEGVNTITLTDLKMGRYRLLVNTVGSPAELLEIPLHVQPPAWLSWPAIILYVIILALIILLIILYMRDRNKRQMIERERQTVLDNAEKKLAFLSHISHDFKTPLSMIIGPVSLMKENVRDPEERKGLETVYDNAVKLNNMIHRSLELQELNDADENLLILSKFDVVAFCKGIFESFRENNPQKKFLFHSSEQNILIEADAVKFESIITNLLSNACKYSDEGATISLGIGISGTDVEIVVSDDGMGIADNDHNLVFQRMFRSPDTARLREGTGLGLYLIKRYLELMHGNIELYSRKGQGTAFTVTLPISENIQPGHNEKIYDNDSIRPKILIVEDNHQISDFIESLLHKDYACVTADNGRAGLSIAASFNPDLIIVDEMMPVMSGLEMVERLKQNPRLVAIPIIMLTAKSDNKTENDSIRLGIDIFMTKPFEPSALSGRIRQLLKSRSDLKEKMRIRAITEAEGKPIEAESVNEKSLAKIAKIIEENIADPDLNVNVLCEKSGIPNKQLYRLIKKYMDMTPVDYIRGVRLQKAAMLLSQHRFTVAEISYMVGFNTPSYFAKCFQNKFGVKPSQYVSDDNPNSGMTTE